MKIAIYSPYLDTLGGGERYMMTIAETFSSSSSVDVLLDTNLGRFNKDSLKNDLIKRFNLDLEKVNFINAPFGKNSSSLKRAVFLKKYDILFYLTDGSIFYPTAKKNILHIQSPLIGQPTQNLWGKLKLKGWDLIIYNSNFTKKHSENNWPVKSEILYPPVDLENIKPLRKSRNILSVGRFFGFLKDKKHEVLIKAFIDLYKAKKINGWSLDLVGSASEGDKNYLIELENLSKDFPINLYPNLGFEELVKLYGQSSIYWHASGYLESDPTKMEHFGISTVEAMKGGSVPVVINKGGQLEIVENKVSGYLWDSLDQLKDFTLELIKNDSLRERLSKAAQERSKKFGKEIFSKHLIDLVANLK